MNNEIICENCGDPIFIDDDYCWGHEERCPNFGHDDDEEWIKVDCDCGVSYHPECCPICNRAVLP